MIIKQIKKYIKSSAVFLATLAIIASACVPGFAQAQTADGVALTITPPFFTLNVAPGDAWASSIRVVNTNGGTLPVVATVMGFAPSDEQGHGNFVKLGSLANDPDALANWITVSQPSVAVPSDGAVDVPFSIAVPRDASPGGHYAAILIGTQPATEATTTGAHIGVSSFISALIFVRVAGDIKEAGTIKEFSTDKAWYQDPNVNFSIHFANTGNVHIRPVGEIQIYNALGKEEGVIPINQAGDLGYVLPSSTRRFDAAWQGSGNLWDIGEYSAVVTLAYGEGGIKSASQTLTFWVLPLGKLAEDTLVFVVILGCFIFLLKRYIRRTLAREIGQYAKPAKSKSGADSKSKPSDALDLRC